MSNAFAVSQLAGKDAVAPARSPSKHFSREFAVLKDRFDGVSLDVSFRELVGVLPANEYSHGLYPYPARLLRHIPRFLLATDAVVEGIDLVFDPFVGSGTVLLEAQLRGVDSWGVEQNPVAALISRVKVWQERTDTLHAALEDVLAEAKRSRRPLIPSPTLSRWYSEAAVSALGRLARRVAEWPVEQERDVLSLCLALTSRRVATTNPRIPVPVRAERNTAASAADVWAAWSREAVSIVTKLDALPANRPQARVLHGDARDPQVWPEPARARTTLLLSSPPYGAAQKYVRSTSLEAGWLGFAPAGRTVHIERSSVGREHLSPEDLDLNGDAVHSTELRSILDAVAERDPRRAAIYLAYFVDMQRVFDNARTIGVRRIALITGTNTVVGGTIHTSQYLAEMVQSLGYRRTVSLRDPIRGRTLLTTRRNGAPSPAEYIDVFEVSDGV